MKRLQPALAVMHEAVRLYGGVVNKSQGDGIMALFGAPNPHEDHAVRGCTAALTMQARFRSLADQALQIRVGIHTGEVVVQTIEHGLYKTYDAAGSNVHLASRLEKLASPGSILISNDTYLGAKQFVEVESAGSRSVRGIAAPIELFVLTGLRHSPSSALFRSRVTLSSLTGRADQLALLENELESARAGDGRVVGVVGEAGIGKSRLCFEFAERCRARGIKVFEANVLSHGQATPLQPILALLRSYFGIRDRESTDASQQRVLNRLRKFPVSEETSLVLLNFLGLTDPRRPSPNLDPNIRKAQLIELLSTLAQAGTCDATTVLIVEDLQWIDPASEEFVEALADAVIGTSTLLVTNFRPEFRAPLMHRLHYRQVNIPPLQSAQALSVLQEHFGTDASVTLLSRSIANLAQGNPFFLEELVNVVIDGGDLEGTRGAYRLKRGIESLPLPATVQAVISARIDRLDPDAKRLLEVAAVAGQKVSERVLQFVIGLSADDISEGIRKLRHAELLYHVPPFERRIFAFRHPLIQEVVYRSLLQDHRRALHSCIARAIETLYQVGLDERASLLAYHLEQAGEDVKAAQQNVRAAIWVGANDPSQALRSWKKVHELLRKATRFFNQFLGTDKIGAAFLLALSD